MVQIKSEVLSESTDGAAINVANSDGDKAVHTTKAGFVDEILLTIANTNGAANVATIKVGASSWPTAVGVAGFIEVRLSVGGDSAVTVTVDASADDLEIFGSVRRYSNAGRP